MSKTKTNTAAAVARNIRITAEQLAMVYEQIPFAKSKEVLDLDMRPVVFVSQWFNPLTDSEVILEVCYNSGFQVSIRDHDGEGENVFRDEHNILIDTLSDIDTTYTHAKGVALLCAVCGFRDYHDEQVQKFGEGLSRQPF